MGALGWEGRARRHMALVTTVELVQSRQTGTTYRRGADVKLTDDRVIVTTHTRLKMVRAHFH